MSSNRLIQASKILSSNNLKQIASFKDDKKAKRARDVLSKIIHFTKYAKYDEKLKRRENFGETCLRNENMHAKRFPKLKDEIANVYEKFVLPKKVLPSMRSMQFGGVPIERRNERIYNCAFTPVNDVKVFSEIMFLLLSGTGVGFKILYRDVELLPCIVKNDGQDEWIIDDSTEGWADAVDRLMRFYLVKDTPRPLFDFSRIRKKGSFLSTGGKAPGSEPLEICLKKIDKICSEKREGEFLKPIEIHDIICHIANAVVCGGIRRSALISLFDPTDGEMLRAKCGEWWVNNLQRSMCNNSVYFVRDKFTEEEFWRIWKVVEESNAGEPGFYLSNNVEYGTNPCCEIALLPNQFCNLCEVNVSNVVDQADLEDRVRAAAFIGTLQASYTDFHYLRPIWKQTTEKEALIGVGLTGIASNALKNLNLKQAARVVIEENRRVAELIDINASARCTTIKPSGTSSLVLGCSSGVHAYHAAYFVRRIRLNKMEAIWHYLVENHPKIVEDEEYNPQNTGIVCIPQAAPEGAILRNEKSLDLLERVKHYNLNWIQPGHVYGDNTHNISATISIKEDEWIEVGEWLWQNREFYNGLSFLPYSNSVYKQMPFTDCTREEYEEMLESIEDVNLEMVVEEHDETKLEAENACVGGRCEVD